MRTTISIQDGLLEKAKEAALRRKCSLGNVVEDALRLSLLSSEEAKVVKEVSLTTYGGEGVSPGVNLNSHAELLDSMEDL